jgi:hypothetical protein
MIELKREELLGELWRMSKAGSLIVVGGPGSGKSWLLSRFAAQREDAGDAAPLILAEEHNFVESLSQLEKSLELPAGIVATLKGYSGVDKFLIIDSIDALRAERSQKVFRQLISLVHRELPEWKVIASIRTFDASESLELQQLFPISDEDEITALNARHILVPVFSDRDLEQVSQQDPRLRSILDSPSVPLRELLRNAFNLWLIIHLLNENAGIEWLYEIESEVQLFERYWRLRVGSRSDSNDRRLILNDISAAMVSDRTLSLSFRDAYKLPGTSRTLDSLLSDEILRKTQTQRITYFHNILFDFSVAKLLLDEERLFGFLRDPDRSIFFRPSVSYFLTLLWYLNRKTFWTTAERFFARDSDIPARVHVLPGIAIFHSATLIQDLEPLLDLPREIAAPLIESVLRAILAFDGIRSRRASVWLSLISILSNRLSTAFLNEYISLIELASHQKIWTPEEYRDLSLAARRLLAWLWETAASNDQVNADALLSIAAGRIIPLVARYYSVDPIETRESLRQVLNRIGKRDGYAGEAYSLANSLDDIIDSDPAFAVEVYSTTFGYKESSQKITQLGSSKVLVLTSTRAQDYSMAYYILGVKFHKLLKKDLTCATLAAIRSTNKEVKREHGKTATQIGRYSSHFVFAGMKTKLTSDRSELWDQGYRDNVSLQILDSLIREISERLVAEDLSVAAAWSLFAVVAKENRFPVVWKRVIEHAAHSSSLLPFAVSLLQTPEILIAPETTVAAGELIEKQFRNFTAVDKDKVEAAIWSSPNTKLAKLYRDATMQRNRLLACIPEDERSLRTRVAIDEATQARTLLPNQPFMKIGPVHTQQIDSEYWLRREGVNVDEEPNRRLLAAKSSLSVFEGKYLNDVPPSEEIDAIVPALRSAFDLFETVKMADDHVSTDLLTSIAAVAKYISRRDSSSKEDSVLNLIRSISRVAARYPLPLPANDADKRFDTPMWGPTPKIEAAQTLMYLIRQHADEEELRDLIIDLSKDQSPAVRYQIANGLGWMYTNDATFFWNVAGSMLHAEKTTGVLTTLAQTVGNAYIAEREPLKVAGWMESALRRKAAGSRAHDVFSVALSSLIGLYVYLDNQKADSIVKKMMNSPIRYARELEVIANAASQYLTYKIGGGASDERAIRARGKEIEFRVLSAVDNGLQLLEERSRTSKRGSKGRAESFKQLLTAVDRIGFRLHILINANPELGTSHEGSLDESQINVLYEETSDLWEALVGVGSEFRRPMAPSTAHHLMESFNKLISFDPVRVLKMVYKLITGRTLGYQFDQLAIGEFTKFADRFLADHREILRDKTNAIYFADILNVFVRAGWPEAVRAVMRMDSAVR